MGIQRVNEMRPRILQLKIFLHLILTEMPVLLDPNYAVSSSKVNRESPISC